MADKIHATSALYSCIDWGSSGLCTSSVWMTERLRALPLEPRERVYPYQLELNGPACTMDGDDHGAFDCSRKYPAPG